MKKITLQAINDPEVRVSGNLTLENTFTWEVRLAKGARKNVFVKNEWQLVTPPIPTALGTVFRATVDGVPNVRVAVAANGTGLDNYVVISGNTTRYWYDETEIDPSTVVIELEGVDSEND